MLPALSSAVTRSRRDDAVAENADALYFGLDHVLIVEILGRRPPETDSVRRAGGDDVARLERHAAGQKLEDGVDTKDHVRRGRILFGDAVDAKADPLRLRIAELVGGHDPRAHRTESVQALPLEPLQ